MADKEIVLPFNEISNPQTITQRNEAAWKERGMDMHVQEVMELVDDHKKQVRVIKVRHRKYIDMGKRS